MNRMIMLCFMLLLPAAMQAADVMAAEPYADPSAELPQIRPYPLLEEPALTDVLAVPGMKFKKPSFAYMDLVRKVAEKHGVNWRLVAAVMKAESNFNHRATSPAGAIGLMQLMPRTASLYKVKASELYDPHKNVEAGVQHLKKLINRYAGNLELAVAAYNSGEYAVDRYRGIPPYRATRTFVKKVLEHYITRFD